MIFQCHYSYGACGLGSDGTDKLVALVQEMQHSKSSKSCGGTLFGAKITGGGSGGSVCIMGKNLLSSSEQIHKVSLHITTCKFNSYQSEFTISKLCESITAISLYVQIQEKYKATTGFFPYVFEGSSPGAGKFGYLKIRVKSRSNS